MGEYFYPLETKSFYTPEQLTEWVNEMEKTTKTPLNIINIVVHCNELVLFYR